MDSRQRIVRSEWKELKSFLLPNLVDLSVIVAGTALWAIGTFLFSAFMNYPQIKRSDGTGGISFTSEYFAMPGESLTLEFDGKITRVRAPEWIHIEGLNVEWVPPRRFSTSLGGYRSRVILKNAADVPIGTSGRVITEGDYVMFAPSLTAIVGDWQEQHYRLRQWLWFILPGILGFRLVFIAAFLQVAFGKKANAEDYGRFKRR